MIMNADSTLNSFLNSPYFSIKHTNYFDIYDKILCEFVGKKITFVEIGVLEGGSLFMWRSFLGKEARIIGIDLNPEAIKWRKYGFEIYIGDQSSPQFWQDLFGEIGSIDVLLDDGGHRNDQQIVTTESALPYILDGGFVIVEDTHTSFMKFESFRRYNYVRFLQNKIASLYSRSDEVYLPKDFYTQFVYSIEFFTGICVLKIDRTLCEETHRIENSGVKDNASDFRYENDGRFIGFLRAAYDWISWDYMTKERVKKHRHIYGLMQLRAVKFATRLVIIPLRFLIYLLLKIGNLIKLKKALNELKFRKVS